MITHLLDSSAFLAWFYDEPGSERVTELFKDQKCEIGLSILSQTEFWSRLKADGAEASFLAEWKVKSKLFEDIFPVNLAVGFRSIEIRDAATARIPAIDSLIAATASVQKAILVHRDAHFLSIPENLLKQESLE